MSLGSYRQTSVTLMKLGIAQSHSQCCAAHVIAEQSYADNLTKRNINNMDPAVMNQARFYINYKHSSKRLYASLRSLWQSWPQDSKEMYKFSTPDRYCQIN